jgi:hypothetical protein
LAECIPSKPTHYDLIGLWVESSTTCGKESSAPCGTFEFFPDGRFEAQNIPGNYFIDLPTVRIDTSGLWELDTSSNDPFAVHRIKLIFNPIQEFPLGFTSEMFITIDGKVLFQGLEGHEIIFEKNIIGK